MGITIGKLAGEVGVSIDAIRFYEREGLLRPARKTDSGYRLFDGEAARRVRFIKQAQHCGFALAEIRELLDLRRRDDACCDDIRNVAVAKKLAIEHKIRALQGMADALSELIVRCNAEGAPLDECPILAALETSVARAAHDGR